MADSGDDQSRSTMSDEDTKLLVFTEGGMSFSGTESDSSMAIPTETGPVALDLTETPSLGARKGICWNWARLTRVLQQLRWVQWAPWAPWVMLVAQ